MRHCTTCTSGMDGSATGIVALCVYVCVYVWQIICSRPRHGTGRFLGTHQCAHLSATLLDYAMHIVHVHYPCAQFYVTLLYYAMHLVHVPVLWKDFSVHPPRLSVRSAKIWICMHPCIHPATNVVCCTLLWKFDKPACIYTPHMNVMPVSKTTHVYTTHVSVNFRPDRNSLLASNRINTNRNCHVLYTYPPDHTNVYTTPALVNFRTHNNRYNHTRIG